MAAHPIGVRRPAALYAGQLWAILAKLFPIKVRFTTPSISYSLVVTISSVSPAFFVIFAVLTGITTPVYAKDRTNARLA